ncbi:LD-carboxypeptidase [Pseudoruegeria sp. SK021]|nr:S66 peptidase family protein [Pseudoruegeria sp. SK021]OSP55288.1 LD-carboxypeptidase [Pseudoruegeria sp. SK021]
MTLVRPPRLRWGDRLAAVTPCWGGPSCFPQRFEAGKAYLTKRFGLEVVDMPHTHHDADWLDCHPEARAADLMQAFADPSIRGIVASIGGDDAIRLLPHLDLDVIRSNPKVFIGYSDVTVLHFACLRAGLGSFHGPTIMSGFAENAGMTELAATSFERATFDPEPIGLLPTNSVGWTVEACQWQDATSQKRPRTRIPSTGLEVLQGNGVITGRLLGGCAEVMEMLKGTPWWPPLHAWDGAVLFYETSEEAPDASLVLRWLRNYAAQGILHRLSAILLARPGGRMTDLERKAQKAAVRRGLAEAGLSDMPVLADLDIGHTDPILTLPYGARVEINADTTCIRLLDAGVT